MQTVPSLIGTGTAVAAAATGLIFGQLAEGQQPPSPRPTSKKRKATPEWNHSSRPATRDSAAGVADVNAELHPPQQPFAQPRIPRRSSHAQITPPKASNWRQSYGRQGDISGLSIVEDSRDSFSSNGSWMRRLSIRPLSQHGSIRSSSGPDSQSMFSHGSAAPILSPTTPQLPPNKLVKRSSTKHSSDAGPIVRRSSKSQLPTLRRPATSHQRTATLQQVTVQTLSSGPKFSFDQQPRPRAQTLAGPDPAPAAEVPDNDRLKWKSYFHARVARATSKVSSKKSDSPVSTISKRICIGQGDHERIYLIVPRSVMASGTADETRLSLEADTGVMVEDSPTSSKNTDSSPGATPSKTPRRSISMQFSSPTNWLTKTGSLRRRKRGAAGDHPDTGKRFASDPVTARTGSKVRDILGTEQGLNRSDEPTRAESELAAIFQPPSSSRSSSSPIPPLSRLSSFHVDLNRLGSSSSQSKLDDAGVAPSTMNTLRINSNASQARTLDRASTVGSSEYHRGFTSGDDDDTDFKTDTPFDSLRTVGSGRRRTLDSPLESMFDESPPSTAGNNKQPKRLSIQEILGPSFDGGNKIMEEEENLPTPVRGTYDRTQTRFRLAHFEDEKHLDKSLSPHLLLASREFARLSLDDDDDLDWARDDDFEVCNHLSPPSSMNSRKGSPNHSKNLAVSPGIGPYERGSDTASERPRSTVFDWAEPNHHDKHEGNGHSPRPKTVHGKQEMDPRGGRSANRRGPVAAHVRSQSVPVVPDPTDSNKSVPKFGTWGLSSKNVSEDWDDDFEFDEEPEIGRPGDDKPENRLSMLVPASIQATQPTVKAHSGQIRELSLLVNDLKRLCRLGREMDMLTGPSVKLWRDAEGIIALASPDEDTSDDMVAENPSDDFDPRLIDERFLDGGFDGGVLDRPEHQGKTPEQIKTTVVRERPLARRRSVFSPEDDIFGNWSQARQESTHEPPRTPNQKRPSTPYNPSSVAKSLMESMHLRRRQPADADYEEGDPTGRLNFDTNSLKELVKRAGDLRDSLSDLVRKADHITQSPVRTPRRDRGKNEDGSPAFTRVFDDPTATPTRQLPQSRSSNSVLSGSSHTTSPSNGLGQRMQMMTVG